MTSAGPDEPDLHLGDSGDAVLHLQTRLHVLQHYEGALDGYFGETTAAALARLAESRGLVSPNGVDAGVWSALADAERDAGLVPPGHDGQQWQWDGDRWQYAAGATPSEPAPGAEPGAGQGQWVWDGTQWQPVV